MPDAARVRIRLADGQDALKKGPNEYYTPSAAFYLTEVSSQVRMPVPMVKQTPGLMEYEILVARGATYRLEAGSDDVVLQNATGQALPKNGSSDTFTVTATSQHQFIYSILSRR